MQASSRTRPKLDALSNTRIVVEVAVSQTLKMAIQKAVRWIESSASVNVVLVICAREISKFANPAPTGEHKFPWIHDPKAVQQVSEELWMPPGKEGMLGPCFHYLGSHRDKIPNFPAYRTRKTQTCESKSQEFWKWHGECVHTSLCCIGIVLNALTR